jgi:hypothetical protein
MNAVKRLLESLFGVKKAETVVPKHKSKHSMNAALKMFTDAENKLHEAIDASEKHSQCKMAE